MKQSLKTPKEQIRFESPVGRLIVSARSGEVCAIALARSGGDEIPTVNEREPVLNQAAKEIQEYFDKKRNEFAFAMRAEGTTFQKSVWQALLTIPHGETRTYSQIARQIENPKGARAVGMACNKNPIMIAVPCHRVVGADGSLTGYAYGTGMKQSLLDLEQRAK